ncbi:hypothetical protein L0B53_04040 [Vibrio sp. SS-MA-C1-2]|uniref:hypothetical protein n=1 Tax=Vibrio sp. SS-MA-C1-2 TaxID=2908646 RepID=UPI001F41E178|nr:hypothetical protein [Vibrio sp. SS-MA-C1-2]UJF17096.1 hypothetical protein L0B53_04040 [Vibrio sp. SS-MA-C1-2]
MMQRDLEKLLMKEPEVKMALIDDIKVDPDLQNLIQKADPVSGTRLSYGILDVKPALLNIRAYQNMMLAYQYRSRYYLLSGFFTYKELLYCSAKEYINKDSLFPIAVFNQKPPLHLKRQIFLSELTHHLLNLGFTSHSNEIGHYLQSWFNVDEGKRSLFQSKEWQSLYPHITTKAELARRLNISERGL